jgi:hypothetical protein
LIIDGSNNKFTGGFDWTVGVFILVVCNLLTLGALEKSVISFWSI